MNKTDEILQIDQLSVNYGHTAALSNISLDLYRGECLGIIGPNGGGKTTLLRAILSLVPIAAGNIRLCAQHRLPIGYVPQISRIDRTFPITVRESVLTGRLRPGLSPFHRYTRVDTEFVDSIIEKVGLQKVYRRQVSDLSGGEFQKMLLARALATEPKLLLLDEPTANVDGNAREQIYALLKTINVDMSVLLVTHDIWAACAHSTRIAYLDQTLLYIGDPTLCDDLISKLYGHPVFFEHKEAK